MHYLLQQLLDKAGIKSITELQKSDNAILDESSNFEHWDRVLSEGEVTVEKIQKFCQSQINAIEKQFQNLDNNFQKNDRLLVQHTVYRNLLHAITAPEQERIQLERYLQQLLRS